MELQIKDLVESIKKEGVETAEREAEKIIKQANEKAAEIVKQAKADAQKAFDDSKKEIDILKESAKVSAEQAKRDAVLAFKKEVQSYYEKLLKDNVKKVMSSDALSKLVLAAIADEDVSKLSLEVSSVSEALKSELAEQVKKGLEIRPVKGIDAGFRISSKDGSGFFDCTDEEIAKILSPFFGELNF